MKLSNAMAFSRYIKKHTQDREYLKKYQQTNMKHFELYDHIPQGADPVIAATHIKINAATGKITIACYLQSRRSGNIYPGKHLKSPSNSLLLSKLSQADRATNSEVHLPTLAQQLRGL